MSVLFGTKDFYRKTFRVVLPIMVRNAVTNVVGLLDNIMVGRSVFWVAVRASESLWRSITEKPLWPDPFTLGVSS